jgi:type IV secretory pathway VirB10-like protein
VSEEKQSSELNTPAAQTSPHPPESSPALRDKRIVPEGVVPKQAQGYVVAGLAVLILMAVLFSKNHVKPAAKDAGSTPLAIATDMNQRKIQELEQDLSASQRQSQQQAQTAKAGAGAGASPGTPGSATANPTTAVVQPAATEPPRDPVADAERSIAFKARFASNLISVDASRSSAPLADSTDTMSRPNTGAPSARTVGLPQQAPVADDQKRASEVSVNSAHGQPYVLFEGTTIDTALLHRLNGDFSGPVKVMVTNPIYSHDNQHVLIPEGTFLLGDIQQVSGLGQRRLAVTFHRMIMPDGYSVDLDKFHGLNQIGETGLTDKINNHYVEIFGTSIALGIIAGAAESTTDSGDNRSGSDAIRQGMASSLSASAAHVLDRFINIPPTITIREGHRVKVYLTQDLLLPAYENHSIPGDI